MHLTSKMGHELPTTTSHHQIYSKHINRRTNTMAKASERDTEQQRAAHEQTEQTPLLGDHQSGQQGEADREGEDEVEKRSRLTSWWLWRGFWVIIASLVLAVFVKGWIDAGGDVEVRYVSLSILVTVS